MQVSDRYSQLLDKARWSHAHGRSAAHISQSDIDAARLFSYSYRTQAIGVFHATQAALAAEKTKAEPHIHSELDQCSTLLEQLEAKAMDPIQHDSRALISTLYSYDQWTRQVSDLLAKACAAAADPKLESIRQLFLTNIQKVTNNEGIYIASDLQLPEQGAFIVPDLDISIAPIIYGDHHSWNAAFLVGSRPGVSVHRHHQGVEIHLGYSSVQGRTILGSSYSEVNEGYAMPIPPMTDHGFLNTSGHDHVLPFVFGSLKMGGWGIFFDVEPRPGNDSERKPAPLESEAMNHSIPLEQVIRRTTEGRGFHREVLVPAARAGNSDIGGLELSITRLDTNSIELRYPHYRIVSVQSGKCLVEIGGVKTEVGSHGHFGIPSHMDCRISAQSKEPLVYLESMILPIQVADQRT